MIKFQNISISSISEVHVVVKRDAGKRKEVCYTSLCCGAELIHAAYPEANGVYENFSYGH